MKTEITIIPVCQLKAGNQIFLDQDKKPVDVLGIEADPDFPGNTLVIFQRQDLNCEATIHLRWLAQAKATPIIVLKDLPYRAVALIKELNL